MVDDASRRWNLSDSDLLTHFDLHYPQVPSWTLQPLNSKQYCLDSCALEEMAARRLSRQRNVNACTAWRLWESFCSTLHLDPHNLGRGPMPLLLLFAQQYRTGSTAPGRNSVHAWTVEDAIQTIGQTYARLGSPDPRLNIHGDLNFRISLLYRAWQRDDAPPTRVKPLSLSVVGHMWNTAVAHQDTSDAHAAA